MNGTGKNALSSGGRLTSAWMSVAGGTARKRTITGVMTGGSPAVSTLPGTRAKCTGKARTGRMTGVRTGTRVGRYERGYFNKSEDNSDLWWSCKEHETRLEGN